MDKPTENASLVIGAAVTVISFVAEKVLHVTLTNDVLIALPVILGVLPHGITTLVDKLHAHQDAKIIAQHEAEVAASLAARAAKAASDAEFKAAVRQAAIDLIAEGNLTAADKPATPAV